LKLPNLRAHTRGTFEKVGRPILGELSTFGIIRRIYTPAKIHIRSYEYGCREELCIHPCIYGSANPALLHYASM